MTDAPESPAKSNQAFRTIGEAAEIIGVPQHVLRFWETRFSQLQPLKRGGNRRYYRPADMELLRRIRTMLHDDGLTIRGAQQLLAGQAKSPAPAKAAPPATPAAPSMSGPMPAAMPIATSGIVAADQLHRLRAVRDRLRNALSA